jgi:hypothetical protein
MAVRNYASEEQGYCSSLAPQATITAVPHGLHAPYAITPEEAWMVRPLNAQVLGTVKGTVVCAQSLQPEQYWRE